MNRVQELVELHGLLDMTSMDDDRVHFLYRILAIFYQAFSKYHGFGGSAEKWNSASPIVVVDLFLNDPTQLGDKGEPHQLLVDGPAVFKFIQALATENRQILHDWLAASPQHREQRDLLVKERHLEKWLY